MNKYEIHDVPLERYMSSREAANLLNIEEQTLRKWRTNNEGPAYMKVRRSVVYKESDLQAFMTKGRVETKDAQEAGTEIEQQCSKVVRELEAPKTLQASFISRTLKRVDEDRTVIEVEEQSE